MQEVSEGRLIQFTAALNKMTDNEAAKEAGSTSGQTLLMEPRTVRHQERVEDLFYLLFKRTGT